MSVEELGSVARFSEWLDEFMTEQGVRQIEQDMLPGVANRFEPPCCSPISAFPPKIPFTLTLLGGFDPCFDYFPGWRARIAQ